MKKILLATILLISGATYAQNVGIGTKTPDPSAILDLNSTSKGFLLPRLKESQRNAIPSPKEGLIVYQNDGNKGIYIYQSGRWNNITSLSSTNTRMMNASIGTLTPNYLLIGDSNGDVVSSSLFIDPTSGNIGIGTTSPQLKFDILGSSANAGVTGFGFGNSSSGHSNRAFLGLTGSEFSYASVGSNTTMFTAAETSKLALATTDANPIQFITNYQERMRITPEGKIGIGVQVPTLSFQMLGNSSTGGEDGFGFGNSGAGHNNPAYFSITGSALSRGDVGGNTTVVTAALTSKLAFATQDQQPIQFITNNIERFRINANGRIAVGDISNLQNPTLAFQVLGTSSNTNAEDGFGFANPASGHVNPAFFSITGSTYSYGSITANTTVFNAAETSKLAFVTKDANPIQFVTNNVERIRVSDEGRVGIGVSSPTSKLQVDGDASFKDILKLNTSTGYMAIGNFDAAIPISIPSANGYRLVVEGGILTERMNLSLKNSASWADYVFEPSYHLMPLNEVEDFVKENKHLPNVPSADEMVQKGLDVAQTSKMFMEKIEELTLYMIELKKEVDALKIENASLKK